MSERQRAREVHAFALCDVVGLCGLLCDGFVSVRRTLQCCAACVTHGAESERRTVAVIAPDPGKSSKNATVADRITIVRIGFARAARLPLATAARRRSQHEGRG